MIGQTIGHYKILEKLGEGGMGEVYRAEDTTLARDVAIKVLPEAFTDNPERLARFEREAKLLATLNHPHIAQIHALEDVDGQKLLVMELVEGETLAGHIAKGPLPLDDSLRIALQIAQGLEAAHERGIVHRDLKPANIKLTPAGEVKVLDFGLAKPITDAADSDLSHSPTLTYSPTQAGVILGTAAYMSPEQARGQEVDKRSDIWSFGVVLWEMLTGKRLFDGETVSDILAAVLRAEPDWEELPDDTPHLVQRLLRRCLTRDPQNRLHDIADARIDIEEARAEPEGSGSEVEIREIGLGARRWALPLAGLAGLALGVAGTLQLAKPWSSFRTGEAGLVRFNLELPKKAPLYAGNSSSPFLAVSPDGREVIYQAATSSGPQLWVRSIDSLEPRPIDGTEGGSNPFFSPDGAWLGFFSGGQLKKVSLAGGSPVGLCDVERVRGASWAEDGSIYFSDRKGLFRLPPTSDQPEMLTQPDPDQSEGDHYWPQILADGRSLLFTIISPGLRHDEARTAVLSLETGDYRVVFEGRIYGRYLPTGHLLHGLEGTISVVPFDLERLEVTGPVVPILDDVTMQMSGEAGAIQLAVSRSGALVYVKGFDSPTPRTLVWVDRDGTVEPVTAEQRAYHAPVLSPDGDRLAVSIRSGLNADLWTYDIPRDSWRRLTSDKDHYGMVWSPDSTELVFSSNRYGTFQMYLMAADGSGEPEQLASGSEATWAYSWSRTGNELAFVKYEAGTSDIWIMPMEGDRVARPLVASDFFEHFPTFSPDGKWIAYSSNESGSHEVYVQSVIEGGRKWRVSKKGGRAPLWSPVGGELYFARPEAWEVVSVDDGEDLRFGQPRPLVQGSYSSQSIGERNFDVTADAQRFLLVQQLEQPATSRQLVYVPNWYEELQQLMAEKH